MKGNEKYLDLDRELGIDMKLTVVPVVTGKL